ncbi:MAG TPA: alanine racemase [Burkholderiales bacterium]|nr:alanine racemase [Burkholderiales bacterium]
MARPIQASFDLAALKHNLGVARGYAGAAAILAVIKANAYGHGLLRAARAFSDAEGFGLLELDDAVRLREAGFRQRILLLEGPFSGVELPEILHHDFTIMVHSREQLRLLQAVPAGNKIDVFLKFNTGMNRLGFPAVEAARVIDELRAIACIGKIVLATHFSDAEGVSGIDWQMREFETHVARPGHERSLANSAALLRFPEARAEWVRPGFMLYGASPLDNVTARKLDLRPAMTLRSEIIAVQHLKRGDTVGYGGLFLADREMRIGVVACGYADGYPRHANNGVPVLVDGVRVPMAGRVSMDMLCVDLTGVGQARVGSPVVLWGEGLPVEEVAAAAGTVGYELMCALARRVPVVEVE